MTATSFGEQVREVAYRGAYAATHLRVRDGATKRACGAWAGDRVDDPSLVTCERCRLTPRPRDRATTRGEGR